MRHAWKTLFLLAAISIQTAPALAGVPKVVIAEEFGFAT